MLYRESTQTHTYVVKVGPVSGDIYMYGYMTVSPADYISFARIDSSYNIKYSAAYSGFPNVEAWEVDSAESKIYTLIRPISDFSMAIFNTTDGTNLHISPFIQKIKIQFKFLIMNKHDDSTTKVNLLSICSWIMSILCVWNP